MRSLQKRIKPKSSKKKKSLNFMHMKPMKYLAFLYIVVILTVILLCMVVISSLQLYIQSINMDCIMSCVQCVCF